MESSLDGKFVCPGDSLVKLPESGKVRVGSGISVVDGHLVTSKCGIARQTKGGKYWVESRQKRYIPAEGDSVIGLIIDRYGEHWTVDIGGPFLATLPALAFENVTRRNRPNLVAGDLVYGRVTTAPRDADPEIACTDAMSLSGGYGQLSGGVLEKCSTALARKLLGIPTAPVLAALGAHVQYEIAIGMNGRLWIRAPNVTTTVLVINAVLKSEFLSEEQCQILVRKLVAMAVKE